MSSTSGRSIDNFFALFGQLIRFTSLRELDLTDNDIAALPDDLSQLTSLALINLNGNYFDDFEATALALKTLPVLRSLYINLHQEE